MTAAEAISIMTPAVAIGNAISIVLGGILVKVIHSKELNGQGKLMRSVDAADELGVSEEMQAKRDHIDVRNMGIGMFISCSFFAWGYIVARFGIPWFLHQHPRLRMDDYLRGRLQDFQHHPRRH